MLPAAADPSASDSDIAAVKHSASGGDEPRGGKAAMTASPQGDQDTGEVAQTTAVVSGKGKEAHAQDHADDGGSVTAHGAKKLKRQRVLGIDINKALHHDDGGFPSPPAAPAAAATAASSRKGTPPLSSLEIKKRELEIDAEMLELELQRVKWASASMRKDMELEKMRLENDRLKLGNERLWVQLKRRERELGVKSSKRV